MKRNREENDQNSFPISPKKVLIDRDALDEGAKANKSRQIVRQALLARTATKAKKCLSSRLERQQEHLKKGEEREKLFSIRGRLIENAEWPKHLTAEVVDVSVSVSHIIPPASAEGTSNVYILVYPVACHWNEHCGPFRPVRMVVSPFGEWKLTVNLTDVVAKGKCAMDVENNNELISLAKEHFSEGHVLCPGLQGFQDIQTRLGYIPKSVRLSSWPFVKCLSTECKLWYVPKNVQRKDNVCPSCHAQIRYIDLRLKSHDLTEEERLQRQSTSSRLAEKYLSPESKTARAKNIRLERKKLLQIVERYRKRTSISLSAKQSGEVGKLVDVLDKTKEGQKELSSIIAEANKLGNVSVEGKLIKRGDFIKEMWQQEKFLLIKDQYRNVTGKRGNRWSLATIRVALAIYCRSPAAFRAVQSLSILSLPCENTLKKIIKSGSEKPGIDLDYLQSQQGKFKVYADNYTNDGFLSPLQLGVLIFDEVKVQMQVAYNTKSCEIQGYVMRKEDLPSLHDVFSAFDDVSSQKTNYILQFLWRDLTSSFDMIGPYFTSAKQVDCGFILEQLTSTIQSLSQFGFRTLAIVCDGASPNLAAMKILCGLPNKALSNENDTLSDESYFVKANFINPYDPDDIPVFVVICPTHQLKNMISALASSRVHTGAGTKSFSSEGVTFGWEAVKEVYQEDISRAQRNLARLVPGLKYAYIERDSWTKLNVRPSKIMQQRYMLAALRSLAEQKPSSQSLLEKTAQYLEACHMIFERGILSHKLVKCPDCQVLNNIKEGFQFFQEWCFEHENKEYSENTKAARNKNFLAWQTWDLLRLMVSGFSQLCDWFTDNLPGYYICPLRINGSALESIFSILKFASGGNLSALTYGPSLGRHIYRKDLAPVRNPNSEDGYRNVTILTAAGQPNQSLDQKGSPLLPAVFGTLHPSSTVTEYLFPPNISQSTLCGRIGSNACTVIAVLSGFHFIKNKFHVDAAGNLLCEKWCSSLIDAIIEGNRVHDFVYAGAPINLDVEDVADTFGADIHVQAVDDTEYFVVNNNYSTQLCDIVRKKTITGFPAAGVLIANGKSSCIYIDEQSNLVFTDSHKHREKGALILTAKKADLENFVKEVIKIHQRFFNKALLYGALTWVHYSI